MGPKTTAPQNDDLFKSRLDQLLNLKHPLIQLAELIDWHRIENTFAGHFVSERGRPALPPRLVAGLLYLQHTFDCSDELVVNTWVENPYWQYFTGETYLQIQSPIDPSSLTRWRKRIGEEGVETLLLVTIDAARRGGLLKASSLDKIIVDTTVMPKAISHPTDSRLLEKCRQHLVRLVDDNGHGIAPELQPQGATAGSPSGAVCTCAAIQAHEKSGQDAQNKSWPCAP